MIKIHALRARSLLRLSSRQVTPSGIFRAPIFRFGASRTIPSALPQYLWLTYVVFQTSEIIYLFNLGIIQNRRPRMRQSKEHTTNCRRTCPLHPPTLQFHARRFLEHHIPQQLLRLLTSPRTAQLRHRPPPTHLSAHERRRIPRHARAERPSSPHPQRALPHIILSGCNH